MDLQTLQTLVLGLQQRLIAVESRPIAEGTIEPTDKGNVTERRLDSLQKENERLRGEVNELRLLVTDLRGNMANAAVGDPSALDTPELRNLLLEVACLKAAIADLETQRKAETHFQAILEAEFGCGHMHIAGVGTTDITTEDAHIEIKRWGKFQEVLGQLQKYQAAQPRPRSCVYFFGPKPASKRMNMILELMISAGIEVYSFGVDDSVERHGYTEACMDPQEKKIGRAHV